MKKILSLVLAVAMLSSMAFAADAKDVMGASTIPGEAINFSYDLFKRTSNNADISLKDDGLSEYDFNSENFRISRQSFSKGTALVEKVAFDDDESKLVVTLKTNYSLTAPNADNLVIKELSVKAKKKMDYSKVSQTYTYLYKGDMSTKVGFNVAKGSVNEIKLSDGDLSYYKNSNDEYAGGMYKYVKGTDGEVVGIASASGADFYLEGRVYAEDKVYFKATNKPNKDIIKLYENADLRFVNITTNDLPSANDLQITAEKNEFVYKVVDGKIAASGLKWSDDEYAWTGKLRTTTSFVISDIELKITAGTTTGSENPDTGANDVVGVAAALAIVSVVAAAAVSLKK